MIRRTFYGWFDFRHRNFRISKVPPDAPVRPSIGFPSKADAVEFAARKRGQVVWLPPLTYDQERIAG